jgi:hypothetical protein
MERLAVHVAAGVVCATTKKPSVLERVNQLPSLLFLVSDLTVSDSANPSFVWSMTMAGRKF